MREILFLIFGAFLGKVIDVIYGRLFEEQRFLSNLKIVFEESKKDDIKKKITIRELNKLINDQSFDESAAKSGDPLPWSCCPKCGNYDLKRESSSSSEEDSNTHYSISCLKCNWSEWS